MNQTLTYRELMHEITSPSFIIKKNDSIYLNRLQINKAKFWFKKYLDVYNADYVSWNHIELQLSYYSQFTHNLALFKRFYEATHNIWSFILKNYENNSNFDGYEKLTVDQYLDTWSALYQYIRVNDKIPYIFNELFEAVYEIYNYNNQMRVFDDSVNIRFATVYDDLTKNEHVHRVLSVTELISLIKSLVSSDQVYDPSYFLVSGLVDHLREYNKENMQNSDNIYDSNNKQFTNEINIICSEKPIETLVHSRHTSFNEDTNEIPIKASPTMNQSITPSPTSLSSSFDSHYHGLYEHLCNESRENLMKSDSVTNVNNSLNASSVPNVSEAQNENNQAVQTLTLQTDIEIVQQPSKDERQPKAPKIKSVNKVKTEKELVCEYFVEDDMSEEELVKYIISMQNGPLDKLNVDKDVLIENVEALDKTNEEINIENNVSKSQTFNVNTATPNNSNASIFFEQSDPVSKLEYIIKPTLNRIKKHRSGYQMEFKRSSMENLSVIKDGHMSRSMGDMKRQFGYQAEFKHGRTLSACEDSLSRSQSISRTDIRKEFKRSRPHLNSLFGSNQDLTDRGRSFSRNNINQEFKRSRYSSFNNCNNSCQDGEEIEKKSNSYARILRKEFKRSRTSLNALDQEARKRLLSNNDDIEVDNNSVSLSCNEIISKIDIVKNPRVLALKNGNYGREFRNGSSSQSNVSPINFPRTDSGNVYSNKSSIRKMSRAKQTMNETYGSNKNDYGRAYSTQSLPQMDEEHSLGNSLEEEIQKQTLSLCESLSQPIVRASKIVSRKPINKKLSVKSISKEVFKSSSKMSNIDFQLLDSDEIDNIKKLLRLNGIEAHEGDDEIEAIYANDMALYKQNVKGLDFSKINKRLYFSTILFEMKKEALERRRKMPKKIIQSKAVRRRIFDQKMLKIRIEPDAIYEIIDNVAKRAISPVTVIGSEMNIEDRLVNKIVEAMKPFIKQCVKEEVHRYISSLTKHK